MVMSSASGYGDSPFRQLSAPLEPRRVLQRFSGARSGLGRFSSFVVYFRDVYFRDYKALI